MTRAKGKREARAVEVRASSERKCPMCGGTWKSHDIDLWAEHERHHREMKARHKELTRLMRRGAK